MNKTFPSARNLAMVMDLYELTMANGYFQETGLKNTKVAFDVFYRRNPDDGGFAIFAGLEQIVDYITNMHFDPEDIDYLRSLNQYDENFLKYLSTFRFHGDIYAFEEGSIIYPNEPVITVVADIVEAQIVETEILTQFNHQSLIATKAQRVVRAAAGRSVSDFGARRAQGNDAAVYGARACVIGGVNSTSNILAGQKFGIPVSGTMAHSWIMLFGDEEEAFRHFASLYPDNCILLIDTYDVINSGLPNAIKIFNEMKAAGIRSKNYGIRIDSGDLAYLAKKVRAGLNEAGFPDAKIVVSNSLDEFSIASILDQSGPIDAFGVGERMITAKSEPVFGGVYKLCAVNHSGEWEPRIKISDTIEKTTNPGLKEVYRIYDKDHRAIADLITKHGEEVDVSGKYYFVAPERPWKKYCYENCTAKKMQRPVILNGQRQFIPEDVNAIAAKVKQQLRDEIWEEEQRFSNPHVHFLDMSPDYYEMKLHMLSHDRY